MNGTGPKFFAGLLTLAAVLALFLELGRMDVVSDNEGQRAAPPAEMLRSGDYLVPTINGETYLNKPPLLYWAIAGVYRVTGRITAFTARIPTALSAAALVLAVYLAFRNKLGEHAARWAALALLAAPFPLQLARTAELDVPLTLATFLSIMAYREAFLSTTPGRAAAYTLGSGVALAAAILLKGPVPLLFLLAAWMALLAVHGTAPEQVVRAGLRWTVTAAAISLLLMALQLTGIVVRFPVALTVLVLGWLYVAWQLGGPRRAASLWLLLATVVVGAGLAAPWGIAVLNRLGGEYIASLLHSQVTERTYVASAINSGDPTFYLRQLVGMVAPWSLLLPLHFSRRSFYDLNDAYRFTVAAGWLSVAIFSLIAGKETEYILPAVPLLLGATGVHLARYTEGLLRGGMERWTRIWVKALLVLLPVAALAGPVYAALEEPFPTLIAETAVFALAACALAAYGWRRPERRPAAVLGLTLFVLLSGLLIRSYHYTGQESPRPLAELAGRLTESGYRVEAVKVYPAFAFYAATPIPVEIDPAEVRARLEGPDPYFYVAREGFLEQAREEMPDLDIEPLTPAFTSKDLVLIGNRPLPDRALEGLR